MARFCFFTDPGKLKKQQPAEAFGPMSANAFNVTDLHTAAGDAIAVAVCDGQLRVQEDGAGGLTLILKPDNQPPFDFPFISYFLYKGIKATSLVVAGAIVSGAGAADNDLIAATAKSWKNNKNEGDPPPAALGLDLKATTDPPKYSDDQPLDRLFYGYPKKLPPIPVVAGDRLAKFDTQFGFEIVVEQMDRQPPLKSARNLKTVIPARPAGGSTDPNDAAYFLHWHDKEAILGFVDPCCFWGSFFQARLRASALSGSAAVDGKNIYAKVLCGAGGESDAAFHNRNRAYLDIRDEYGHSMNYYKAASVGNEFKIGFEDRASLTKVNYYDSGWPSYWIKGVALPALPNTAAQLKVWFALPVTDYSRPLSYVSVGHLIPPGDGKILRPFTEQQRFIDREAGPEPFYLEPGDIAVPLVPGSSPRFAASYQKISHFKRHLANKGIAPPANLAPIPPGPPHISWPAPSPKGLPLESGKAVVRTYADVILVHWPSASAAAFVARPGIACDGANIYLFLFPVLRYLRETGKKEKAESNAPGLQILDHFLPDYFTGRAGAFVATTLIPVQSTLTLPGTSVQVVHEATPGHVRRAERASSEFVAVALPKADYEAAILPPDPLSPILSGTGMLALSLSPRTQNTAGQYYSEAVAAYWGLQAAAAPQTGDIVARSPPQSLPTLYAHEDL